jgi:hypothetical protein
MFFGQFQHAYCKGGILNGMCVAQLSKIIVWRSSVRLE